MSPWALCDISRDVNRAFRDQFAFLTLKSPTIFTHKRAISELYAGQILEIYFGSDNLYF